MSRIDGRPRPAPGWLESSYCFGPGLRKITAGRTFEVIPYVGEDGRGLVAGYAIAVDRRIRGRYPGPIAGAIAAAEELIARDGA